MDPREDLGLREAAVSVRRAYKRFSPTSVVLRGLDMTVLEGTIYGLLGPSGCGKTTLLRCLLDRTQLDAGEIYVKAKELRNIGYMPQELALYQDLTIAETFNFYGRLFGMHWGHIEDRGLDLLKFLDLPESERFIGHLSGGQVRRVSFAIALLHDPQLLILDEPTAGVDPILSASIWERLLKMAVSQKKTIIITTHYIEEARQAHTIGLMRHGVLLAEESPQQLMAHQNCSNLEQAFLQLSQRQHDQIRGCDDLQEPEDYPSPSQCPRPHLKPTSLWNVDRFLAQLMKNFVWNMRNIPMLLFVLMLPAFQAILCNVILGSEPHNMALGVLSAELPHGLSDCEHLPPYNCSAQGPPLSCSYLEVLRHKQLKLKEFKDLDSARQSVERGESWGYLYFPENYTRALMERIESGQTVSDQVLDESLVDVWLDMSNLWVSSMIKRDMILGVVDYVKNLLLTCNFSPELADIPLKFEEPIYGMMIPKFIHFCTPGLILSFCFYLPIMFTTGAIMMEREAGLLERSLIAGMTILEVVVAHTVLQLLLVTAQNVVIFISFYVLYYNPFYGSLTLIMALVWLVEFMGISYAFLLAVFFDSEKLATYAGVGTIVLMFIMCGIVWPYQGMHWAVRTMVSYTPLQPAVEAYRAIAERAWGLENPIVRHGFCTTLAWIAIFSSATYYIAKKKKLGT
ncbi:ABC transporter G family member 23-like isoform X1 [Homalodisca vitripennis]|uniref:ABC transporter G family member 23-like isoform X1 n=2 Tax=Homalodisca vitripennis TaxID=197043 RepID=UPI001EEB6985|nr:ABC transporter G family member 23-like isoform X1 [Homalodisca vitripennis]XP_046683657.1 ABC transporter G family member 23-like isoform X1 [Homalodisca vitripennis]